eukprot:6210800-Pleurochrysis_carterae.AAC.1
MDCSPQSRGPTYIYAFWRRQLLLRHAIVTAASYLPTYLRTPMCAYGMLSSTVLPVSRIDNEVLRDHSEGILTGSATYAETIKKE